MNTADDNPYPRYMVSPFRTPQEWQSPKTKRTIGQMVVYGVLTKDREDGLWQPYRDSSGLWFYSLSLDAEQACEFLRERSQGKL